MKIKKIIQEKPEKIALVLICYLCLAGFIVFIGGGFYRLLNLEQACNISTPWLGCQYIAEGIITVGSVLLALVVPILTLEWLFKLSIWKILGLIFFLFISFSFGNLILRTIYLNATTKPQSK